jgi:hypothetical protein
MWVKLRTHRKIARKQYLQVAQKKNKSRKAIRRSVRQQLQYLRRDISILHKLLDAYYSLPFNRRQ